VKDKPVERDVERMRELLARTPPADTGAAGRADAVVKRARRDRRRRGIVGGVAVAAFATAVIVTPHLLKTSPTTNEATDPTNGVGARAGDPLTTDPCPAEPIDISQADVVPALPSGAESVRLCRAVWPHVQGAKAKVDLVSSWQAPLDALVVNPDSFVEAVAEAPVWDPAECSAVRPVPDPFAVVVTYADETKVLGAVAPVCSTIDIGGRQVGSDEVVAAFKTSLQSQREVLAAPKLVEPDCGSSSQQKLSTFEIDRFAGPTTAGVVCYTVDPMGSREYANDEGALTDDQIALIESDMQANRAASRGRCIDSGPVRVIRFADEWGDVTSWVDDRCTGDFASAVGTWSPSAEAERAIADALGGRV
jgi:hypothetical protein